MVHIVPDIDGDRALLHIHGKGGEGTLGFDYTTDPSERVSAAGRFDGEFWTGRRTGGSGTVTVRRGAAFSGSVTVDCNDVRLPQGRFFS